MNDPRKTPEDTGRSLSTDCDDFWLDGPGDHTVRECPPYLLEHAKAERAKILAAQATVSQKPPDDAQQH